MRALVLVLAVLLGVTRLTPPSASRGAPAGSETAIVRFRTPAGEFRAVVRGAALRSARYRLRTHRVGVVSGVLRPGTGVNRGHAWHLDDVRLVDVATEVCDGTAADVDARLTDWLRLGRWCPWSAEVVSVTDR